MELGDSRPPGREPPLPGSNRGVLSSRLLLGKWSTSKAAGGLFLLGPPYQCAPSGGRDIDSCSETVYVALYSLPFSEREGWLDQCSSAVSFSFGLPRAGGQGLLPEVSGSRGSTESG